MRRLAKRTVLALLLGFVAPQAPAQEAGERRVIPVSVIDGEGKLVQGLTAANFCGVREAGGIYRRVLESKQLD